MVIATATCRRVYPPGQFVAIHGFGEMQVALRVKGMWRLLKIALHKPCKVSCARKWIADPQVSLVDLVYDCSESHPEIIFADE